MKGCTITQNGYVLTNEQCERIKEIKLIRMAKLALKHSEIFAFFTQAPAMPGTMSSNNIREKKFKGEVDALTIALQNWHKAAVCLSHPNDKPIRLKVWF